MIKKILLFLSTLFLFLSVCSMASQQARSSYFERYNFVYKSHHVASITKQFVGRYKNIFEHSSGKPYDYFRVSRNGRVHGNFLRGNRKVYWQGSVVSIWTNPQGDKRLKVHYIIDRSSLHRLHKEKVGTIDTPGVLYIMPDKQANEPIMAVDMIGHWGNFINMNQRYYFKSYRKKMEQ